VGDGTPQAQALGSTEEMIGWRWGALKEMIEYTHLLHGLLHCLINVAQCLLQVL